MQVLLEGQKASNGVYLALVGVRYRMHASATVPQLDFISRTSRKVHIEVRLEGQRLNAVDLTIVCADHLALDILVFKGTSADVLLVGLLGVHHIISNSGGLLLESEHVGLATLIIAITYAIVIV